MVSSFLGKDGWCRFHCGFCIPRLEKKDETGNDPTLTDFIFTWCIPRGSWLDHGGQWIDRRCYLCAANKISHSLRSGTRVNLLYILVCFAIAHRGQTTVAK